ncbi:hypothetical protein LF1_02350 [Rubripirellula obstinata]|uniref:Uncharacterized protein n=1 Tax=Rubripirellula obstinata TaxID=406547 RepID=A0A5B1CCQ8_9BACT|nr:hypothetical protein LF1_02350 [Rubripirellula obstinata]
MQLPELRRSGLFRPTFALRPKAQRRRILKLLGNLIRFSTSKHVGHLQMDVGRNKPLRRSSGNPMRCHAIAGTAPKRLVPAYICFSPPVKSSRTILAMIAMRTMGNDHPPGIGLFDSPSPANRLEYGPESPVLFWTSRVPQYAFELLLCLRLAV